MSITLVSLCLVLAQNPPADVAKLLEPKLALPATVPVVPPPAPNAPQPRPPQGPEKEPIRLWHLAPADAAKAPVLLPDDLRAVPWKRPVADAPPLASERRPTAPAEIVLPNSPRSNVFLPNPHEVPPLARLSPPAEAKLIVKDDPTYDRLHAYLTTPLPVPAPVPPAVLKLAVADPFEIQRIASWASRPADSDPPSVSLERPARPKLPPATVPAP